MFTLSFTSTPVANRRRHDLLLVLIVLSCLLGSIAPARAQWQFTTLYTFSGPDGDNPVTGLIQGADGYLYGTTYGGGQYDNGTIFRLSAAGALTVLHSFDVADGSGPGSLFQGSAGVLYGVTSYGGPSGNGTVFAIKTDGTMIWDHAFSGAPDGADPEGPIALSTDGSIYGTTANGGASNLGTIFHATANGIVTIVYSFTGGTDSSYPMGVASGTDGTIYGETSGGTSPTPFGTVFQLNTDGSADTLYAFSGLEDEGKPLGRLIQTPAGLYGTASGGTDAFSPTGADFEGAVFNLSLPSIFNLVYRFTGGTNGQGPKGGVILGSDGNLYGTTTGGAPFASQDGYGTVFQLTPAGGLTTLYTFTGGADGSLPYAGLLLADDGDIYGAASAGGLASSQYNLIANSGTIFRMSPIGSSTRLSITTPAAATPNTPFIVDVAAIDNAGNVVTSYAGTVHFSSTDPTATLPADTTLTNGTGSFHVTLNTSGSQSLRLTDTQAANVTGISNSVTVLGQNQGPYVQHTFSPGLQMMSAPFVYTTPAINEVFNTADVQLATWQPSASQYAITPTYPADAMRTGSAYWARFSSETELYAVTDMLSPFESFSINLYPGWNMVGDPIEVDVPIANLQVSAGTTTESFAAAAQNGVVGPSIYTYPAGATAYQVETNALQPYAGYWVYAEEPCTLVVPGT